MTTSAYPLRNLPTLALAYLLTACSGGSAGPLDPADPPPGSGDPTWTVKVTLRYLEVEGIEACDGSTYLTNEPRDGEFQYRLEVRSGSRLYGSTESSGFDTFLGEKFSRKPGELINFTNRDVRVASLRPGDRVHIGVFATEWDGTERDDRMSREYASTYFEVTDELAPGDFRDRKLSVPESGSFTCALVLVYDLDITKQVPAVP
jgi:hypothetical protein